MDEEAQNNLVQCPECGAMHDPDENNTCEIDEQYYCLDCVFECDNCGRLRPVGESNGTGDITEQEICDECFSDYQQCNNCENWYNTRHEEMTAVYSTESSTPDYLCEECLDDRATQCRNCDEYYYDDYIQTVLVEGNDGSTNEIDVCDNCRGRDFTDHVQCRFCGRYIPEHLSKRVLRSPESIMGNNRFGNVVTMCLSIHDGDIMKVVKNGTIYEMHTLQSREFSSLRSDGCRMERPLIFAPKVTVEIGQDHRPLIKVKPMLFEGTYLNSEERARLHEELEHIERSQVMPLGFYLVPLSAIYYELKNRIRTGREIKLITSIDMNEYLGLSIERIAHDARLIAKEIYNLPEDEINNAHIEWGDIDMITRFNNWAEQLTRDEAIEQIDNLIFNNNNNRGEQYMSGFCELCRKRADWLDEETGLCQKCLFGGELCPECKSVQGRPACPRCLTNLAYQREKIQTTLFTTKTGEMLANYHCRGHRLNKTTKYRFPDEHPYLYYGVELEMCFRDYETNLVDIANKLLKAGKGLFVAENDSSLDNGFELISRPLSYRRWTSPEVQEILANIQRISNENGYGKANQTSAGMHIHLSKLFFQKNTKKEMYQQIDDFNWIFQTYEEQLRPITEREPGIYNESVYQKTEQQIKRFLRDMGISEGNFDLKMKKRGIASDHHNMVTLGSSGSTIEVRAFRGTNDPEKVLARIELCRNIAHFVRKFDINGTNMNEIIGSKESPELDNLIKKNKIKFDGRKKIKDSWEIKVKYNEKNNQ